MKLNRFYRDELSFLRLQGREFADAHPQLTRFLSEQRTVGRHGKAIEELNESSAVDVVSVGIFHGPLFRLSCWGSALILPTFLRCKDYGRFHSSLLLFFFLFSLLIFSRLILSKLITCFPTF